MMTNRKESDERRSDHGKRDVGRQHSSGLQYGGPPRNVKGVTRRADPARRGGRAGLNIQSASVGVVQLKQDNMLKQNG
jgi:hypothetical protein